MRVLVGMLLFVVQLAAPASATLVIVSIDHPTSVIVDIPGYGWTGSSDGGDLNSLLNSASAGDTVYVDAGTYPDTTHEIGGFEWSDNQVVIGPSNAVAEITISTSGGYAVSTPGTATGCKVVNLTFRGLVSGARGLKIATSTAGPFTVDGCTWNNTGLSIYHTGVGTAADITVTNSRFTAMQDNPALAYIVAQAGAEDWTFSNNDFDMSTATIDGGGFSAFQFRGISNLLLTRNTIRFPASDQSTFFGIWISGQSSTNSDAPTITYNTIDANENAGGSLRGIYFGGTTDPTVGSVDDIFVGYNTIIMPADQSPVTSSPAYGVEIGYDASSSQTYSENFEIVGNKVTGGINGILVAESAVRGTVSRNLLVGCTNGGFVSKDARYTTFTFNTVIGAERGHYNAANGGLSSNNYGNVIAGNLFKDCDAGIYQSTASFAANDSATIYAGNVFDNCGTTATQNTTDLDFATWRAYTPAGGIVSAGIGSIDLSEDDVSSDLRAVKGLPGGGGGGVGATRGLIRR